MSTLTRLARDTAAPGRLRAAGRRGFTLMELIVVVMILGILAVVAATASKNFAKHARAARHLAGTSSAAAQGAASGDSHVGMILALALITGVAVGGVVLAVVLVRIRSLSPVEHADALEGAVGADSRVMTASAGGLGQHAPASHRAGHRTGHRAGQGPEHGAPTGVTSADSTTWLGRMLRMRSVDRD